MLAAAAPAGVTACKNVQLAGYLDERFGDRGVADLVLALIGVDVLLLPPGEAGESLIRIAMSAFN